VEREKSAAEWDEWDEWDEVRARGDAGCVRVDAAMA
jgi:hypothetical protein